MPSVAEVLRRAEQVIGERGWCQGDYEIDGRVCAEGAINVAVCGSAWGAAEDEPDAEQLAHFAGRALGEHVGMFVVNWNDDDGRTQAEVRAALLAAAQRAESDDG